MEQSELQLLLVDLDGCHYGIDIDQIARLQPAAAGPAVTLAELLTDRTAAADNYPRMLIIKQREQLPILINEPEEVVSVPLKAICRLPAVLASPAGARGVWGLVPQPDGFIILLDLYKNRVFSRLLAEKQYRETV